VRVFDSGNSVSNRHGKDFLLLFMYVKGPVFVLGVLGEVSSFILYGSCLL
jgi:hypothetical protein